jgi:hypothetical protein
VPGSFQAAAAAPPGGDGEGTAAAAVLEAPAAAGQAVFQAKLLQPADIQASVALRSEDDAFWGRHVSAMVAALLAAGGWRAEASEYFYQVGRPGGRHGAVWT